MIKGRQITKDEMHQIATEYTMKNKWFE
ncbi:hypothetical protein SCB49_02544 [unidentified eubacterium SCB49]|nr:hypothetical protein SCB49_02544 [unidentified eubacterium SCB49]